MSEGEAVRCEPWQRSQRRTDDERTVPSGFNSNMLEAFRALRPVHQDYLDGKLSDAEYERRKDQILATVR